jgi:hypothetical protein
MESVYERRCEGSMKARLIGLRRAFMLPSAVTVKLSVMV